MTTRASSLGFAAAGSGGASARAFVEAWQWRWFRSDAAARTWRW